MQVPTAKESIAHLFHEVLFIGCEALALFAVAGVIHFLFLGLSLISGIPTPHIVLRVVDTFDVILASFLMFFTTAFHTSRICAHIKMLWLSVRNINELENENKESLVNQIPHPISELNAGEIQNEK